MAAPVGSLRPYVGQAERTQALRRSAPLLRRGSDLDAHGQEALGPDRDQAGRSEGIAQRVELQVPAAHRLHEAIEIHAGGAADTRDQGASVGEILPVGGLFPGGTVV